MAACCGKSKTDMDAAENDAADERPQSNLVSDLSLQRVHEVLHHMSGQKVRKAGTPAAPTKEGDSGSDVDKDALRQSGAVSEAMQLTAKLWGAAKEWVARWWRRPKARFLGGLGKGEATATVPSPARKEASQGPTDAFVHEVEATKHRHLGSGAHPRQRAAD